MYEGCVRKVGVCLTFHPGSDGVSMARFVLPHADGNAAAMYRFSPRGLVTPRMSICSASHPSSRPCTDAMRSATHFFPRRALPPYPDPNDHTSRVSGKCTTLRCSMLHGHCDLVIVACAREIVVQSVSE